MKTEKYYDTKHPNDKPYWDLKDLNKLLSYNGDITIAQSPRNYGKSYAGMMKAKSEMDKGELVCWGRYNKSELAQAQQAWHQTFPDMTVSKGTSDGMFTWFEDPTTEGKIMFFSWNISQNMKGVDFPFTYMICDEFVPERYTQKPRLDTEFADWNSVYKSISRSYGTKVIFFSNNIYWFNPFYLVWDVTPFPKGKILKQTDTFNIEYEDKKFKTCRNLVIENVSATHAIIERNLKQQAIEFTSNEAMQKYFDNETKQEYCNIASCPDKRIEMENYQIMSMGYCLGVRRYNGDYYFCRSKMRKDIPTYVSEVEYINLQNKCYRNIELTPLFEDIFNRGLCVFDNGDSYLTFLRWLRLNRQRL